MTIKINYIDNSILFNNEHINSIEIENKKYFYRIVNDFYNISNGNIVDSILFLDNQDKEINMLSKINVILNYFDFDLNNKKNISEINKIIINNLDIDEKKYIINNYLKFTNLLKKHIKDIDIPLSINSEIDIADLLKLLKISIDNKDDLLENLLLLIDIEKLLNINRIIIFVNLKQYLSKAELIELYKYSIYNEIDILLIDSQSYGPCIDYEKKIIIDNSLEEYVI